MEEDRIKNGLDEVIAGDIEKISDMQIGSKERTDAINELTKLHALRAEEEKLAIDSEKLWRDENSDKKEDKRRAEQAEIDAKERKFNRRMAIASMVVPVVCYGFWYYTGIITDVEGRYIPQNVRDMCRNFKPFKKG